MWARGGEAGDGSTRGLRAPAVSALPPFVWDRPRFVPEPAASASRLRAPRWAPTEHPVAVFSRRQPTATGGLPRARCGVRATDSVPADPTCVSDFRAPRSRIKVSLLTCRFLLLPPANCQPGGRTRAATRMAGLSGAHVSEGNAESCNPILTRLHIAERTEQPPVRNGASWSYPWMGGSHITRRIWIRSYWSTV